MTKQEIIQQIKERHLTLIETVNTLTEEEFELSAEGKWSAGQQLEHIHLSIKPLNQGLMVPLFILQLLYGKSKRPSTSYSEVVDKYTKSISNGGKATGPYLPKLVRFNERDTIVQKLLNTLNSFTKRIDKLSEENLDQLLLPHPLIGKITFREMLYFTIHHVGLHEQIIKRDLART